MSVIRKGRYIAPSYLKMLQACQLSERVGISHHYTSRCSRHLSYQKVQKHAPDISVISKCRNMLQTSQLSESPETCSRHPSYQKVQKHVPDMSVMRKCRSMFQTCQLSESAETSHHRTPRCSRSVSCQKGQKHRSMSQVSQNDLLLIHFREKNALIMTIVCPFFCAEQLEKGVGEKRR